MNAPPLKELCAAATPGPRYVNDRGFTPVRVSSGTPFKPTGLLATFDAGDYAQTREQGFANADLFCRFDPQTALAVYEALRKTDSCLKGNMDYEHAVCGDSDPSSKECDTPARLIRRTLALLDGRKEGE